MNEIQFWWATVHGHDRPEVVRVFLKDGTPRVVSLVGTEADIWASEFIALKVRLIERVLPAGRAAAAVEKLQYFMTDDYRTDFVCDQVIAILQGESQT